MTGMILAGETGPDSGSLYPDFERLANRNHYTHSFLGGRFPSLEALGGKAAR